MRSATALALALVFLLPAGAASSAPLFNAPPAFETSYRPSAAELRDLDGDLDLDLVVVCTGEFVGNEWNGSLVHVFLNPGDGSFPVRADYVVPAAPLGLAVADLDGDGASDLVTANGAPDNLQVLLNDGSGGFTTGVVIPVAIDPVSVTAADLDGDGDMDLASSDQFSGGVSVVMNDGNAQFAAPTFYPLFGLVSGIRSGDLDHDSDNDLLVFMNEVVLLRNDGAGQFGAPEAVVPQSVGNTADLCLFNTDSHLDLVTGTAVWLGQGDGTFAPTAIPTGLGAGHARGFDLDADGRTDVVTNGGIVLADALGGLGPPVLLDGAPTPGPIACGDVDGDQVPDIVRLQAGVAGPIGFAVLLSGRGGGGVATWPRWPAGNSVWTLTAADVDLDGHADVVVGNAGTGAGTLNGSLSTLSGAGDGTLGPFVSDPAGNFVRATAAGDLNGDGAPDVVATNRDAGTVSIFVNDGAGSFAPRVTRAAGTSPEDVFPADLDGDQDLDLVISNAPIGTTLASVTILFGDGAGDFPASQTVPLSGNVAVRVAAGDLNRDGSMDLAVVCSGRLTAGGPINFGLHLLANQGNGTFGPEVIHATVGLPRTVAAADVDLDQDLDLVVTAMDASTTLTSGRVLTFLNDGSGGFGSPISTALRADHFNAACADLNGDARPDLAVPHLGAGVVSVLLGDGAGAFPTRVSAATGIAPRAIGTADFDGDGLRDLAVAHGTIHQVGILLANPAAVAAVPRAGPSGLGRIALRTSPNPFRSSTRIALEASATPETANSTVEILDLSGRRVQALRVTLDAGGRGETVWDGRAASGAPLPSGVYFLRVPGPTGPVRQKVVLIH